MQSDAVGLLEWDLVGLLMLMAQRIVNLRQVNNRNLIKWPSSCPDSAGFAIRMRSGRIFFLFCESAEACNKCGQCTALDV